MEEEKEKQIIREIRAVKGLLTQAEKEMVRQEALGNTDQAMYQSGKEEGLKMALSALRKVAEVE